MMAPNTLRPCGTEAAYARHRRNGESPCDACRAGVALVRRDQRRAKGIRPRLEPQHGTYSGYIRLHVLSGVEACRPCLDAHATYLREWRAKVRRRDRRGKWVDVVYDYLETFGPIEMSPLIETIQERHPEAVCDTIRQAVNRFVQDGIAWRDDYERPFLYGVADEA